MNNNAIGVLGVMAPERSVMDRKMQQVFGQGVMEAYNGSGIGVVGPGDFGKRSIMDQKMQKEFNPYYRANASSCPCGCPSANKKCNCQSCPFASYYQENYCGSCSFSRPTDNPYNPQNSKVKYAPIR